jgi:hypothetical protein
MPAGPSRLELRGSSFAAPYTRAPMALNRENAQTRKEWPVVGVVNDQGAAHFFEPV